MEVPICPPSAQEPGAVVSAALKEYTYITVNRRFDSTIRVAYSKTEIVDSLDDLQHTIVRAALRLSGIDKQLEITTIGDVPAGTGMGSSSSLTVGLLNALYAYQGKVSSPRKLAEQACHIELDVLNKPIGRQDQYAAAYGGVNYIRFNTDRSVDVDPIPCTKQALSELERRSLLVYTGPDERPMRSSSSKATARRIECPFCGKCGHSPAPCEGHYPGKVTSTSSRASCERGGS